ncbi:MAG: hypothetical protein KY055_00735 [Candidatus Nealsonbacteria bacterium]|nr:hypothetical protein [Candidatus Nealsonbacteria bacterium]
MDIIKKIRQVLAIKLPDWVGILCYVLLAVFGLLTILALLFPEWVGNFLVEYIGF